MMAHRRRRLMAQINVVPYIDVMLVLLIIFMITAPLLTPRHESGSAEGRRAAASSPTRRTTSRSCSASTRTGKLYLNVGGKDTDKPSTSRRVLERRRPCCAATQDAGDGQRPIRPCPTAASSRGMVLLQQAGAEKVGFITEPRETKRERR